MSAKTIETVKATAPVVAPLATQITADFYPRLLGNNPSAWAFFNKTNQAKGLQQQALADAVIAYASNIENLGVLGPTVQKISHRHCALGVTPEFYTLVHDTLMASIGEVLGDAVTPDIGEAWSNAVMALAEICIGEEEGLYSFAEQRPGGWRGYKDFTLVKKSQVGTDTVSFDFSAVDAPDVGIGFTPGQYLSIRCPESGSAAPRHYTVTSSPGDSVLQCTTRHVKGDGSSPDGVVSTFMHTQLGEGDVVQLAAPFGVFTKEAALAEAGSVKFVTAGIGITLARALSRPGGVATSGMLHVDRSDGHTAAVVDEMKADILGPTDALYGKSRSDVMAAIEEYGSSADADFVLCGPVPFMRAARDALAAGGAKSVRFELFGTGNMK